MAGFEEAVAFTLREEGGYGSNPADSGKETKFGISKKEYPDLDIASLTVERAKEIYKRDFWDRAGCQRLPWPLSAVLFDSCVHHGVHEGVVLLQRAVLATPDGKLGPETVAAAGRMELFDACQAALVQRRAFFIQIVNLRPSQGRFLVGWLARLDHLRQLVVGATLPVQA